MTDQKCIICGEPAAGLFADNPDLPLCGLITCEWALIDSINGIIQLQAEPEAEEPLEGDT